MEARVIEILNDICGADDGEIDANLDLFESGLLDSFALVQVVVELESRLGATLDISRLAREDIATPAKIAQQAKLGLRV